MAQWKPLSSVIPELREAEGTERAFTSIKAGQESLFRKAQEVATFEERYSDENLKQQALDAAKEIGVSRGLPREQIITLAKDFYSKFQGERSSRLAAGQEALAETTRRYGAEMPEDAFMTPEQRTAIRGNQPWSLEHGQAVRKLAREVNPNRVAQVLLASGGEESDLGPEPTAGVPPLLERPAPPMLERPSILTAEEMARYKELRAPRNEVPEQDKSWLGEIFHKLNVGARSLSAVTSAPVQLAQRTTAGEPVLPPDPGELARWQADQQARAAGEARAEDSWLRFDPLGIQKRFYRDEAKMLAKPSGVPPMLERPRVDRPATAMGVPVGKGLAAQVDVGANQAFRKSIEGQPIVMGEEGGPRSWAQAARTAQAKYKQAAYDQVVAEMPGASKEEVIKAVKDRYEFLVDQDKMSSAIRHPELLEMGVQTLVDPLNYINPAKIVAPVAKGVWHVAEKVAPKATGAIAKGAGGVASVARDLFTKRLAGAREAGDKAPSRVEEAIGKFKEGPAPAPQAKMGDAEAARELRVFQDRAKYAEEELAKLGDPVDQDSRIKFYALQLDLKRAKQGIEEVSSAASGVPFSSGEDLLATAEYAQGMGVGYKQRVSALHENILPVLKEVEKEGPEAAAAAFEAAEDPMRAKAISKAMRKVEKQFPPTESTDLGRSYLQAKAKDAAKKKAIEEAVLGPVLTKKGAKASAAAQQRALLNQEIRDLYPEAGQYFDDAGELQASAPSLAEHVPHRVFPKKAGEAGDEVLSIKKLPKVVAADLVIKSNLERAGKENVVKSLYHNIAKDFAEEVVRGPQAVELARFGARGIETGWVRPIDASLGEKTVLEVKQRLEKATGLKWVDLNETTLGPKTGEKVVETFERVTQKPGYKKGDKIFLVPEEGVGEHIKALSVLVNEGEHPLVGALKHISTVFDYTLRPFNTAARIGLTLFGGPGYLARNMTTAGILPGLVHGAGGYKPGLQGMAMAGALASIGTGGEAAKNFTYKLASGEVLDTKDILKIFEKPGLLNTTEARLALDDAFTGGRRWNIAKRLAQRSFFLMPGIPAPKGLSVYNANMAIENYQKLAIGLGFLKSTKPADIERMFKLTSEYAGNYARMSPFEQNVLRDVTGFYGWTRYIWPMMAKTLINNPQRVAPWLRAEILMAQSGQRDTPYSKSAMAPWQREYAFMAPKQFQPEAYKKQIEEALKNNGDEDMAREFTTMHVESPGSFGFAFIPALEALAKGGGLPEGTSFSDMLGWLPRFYIGWRTGQDFATGRPLTSLKLDADMFATGTVGYKRFWGNLSGSAVGQLLMTPVSRVSSNFGKAIKLYYDNANTPGSAIDLATRLEVGRAWPIVAQIADAGMRAWKGPDAPQSAGPGGPVSVYLNKGLENVATQKRKALEKGEETERAMKARLLK